MKYGVTNISVGVAAIWLVFQHEEREVGINIGMHVSVNILESSYRDINGVHSSGVSLLFFLSNGPQRKEKANLIFQPHLSPLENIVAGDVPK